MLKKLSSVKSLEFTKVRRKGEFKDDAAKRGRCLKVLPELFEVTDYSNDIEWSEEAHSLVTVHMLFSL